MNSKNSKNSKTIKSAKTVFSINEVAEELGLSQIYVRRMISEKKIETSLVPQKEGSKTMKHQITAEAIAKWRAESAVRSRREDNRSKFTLYASMEEQAQIALLLQEHGIKAIIERANKVKTVVVAE